MKPTIGRIVHYDDDGITLAALITATDDGGSVCLCIFAATGLRFEGGTPYSPTPKLGHWNWPPREELPKNRASGGYTGGAGIMNVGGPASGGSVANQHEWCNQPVEPTPGDVAIVISGKPVEYGRPTSPIPDDAADRLRYLARAPRKRTN